MNLVQLGTTASRANRGKSVNDSIAQGMVLRSYDGKRMLGSLIPKILCPIYSGMDRWTHLNGWGQRL
jgi:hypothetical protein